MASTNKLKAKCAENQEALDRLAEKRINATDNYALTLKRAMNSLKAATHPITTYAQAMDLKYVGQHCASIICPKKKRVRGEDGGDDDDSSVGSLSQRTQKVGRKVAPVTSKQQQQQLTTIPENEANKSTKQRKYDSIMNTVDDWKKHPQLIWKVILLIDGRERKSEHVIAKCQMSGIPCDVRNLPIGDMAWIARGQTAGSTDDAAAVVELLLGTIVERKTPDDLKSSIFGSRYNEQRLRLKHSGLPQVLFLIEGDLKDQPNCPADTLHSAMWETSLHLGFQTVQTEHMEGTVRTLKRIHRRILQRSFPQAFKGNLPTFLEALSTNRPAAGRRRVQSLAEMTFDEDPALCFGMKRFVTYEELKARVERDREVGTKTVGGIQLAMLKQVPTFSDKKCKSVAQRYPTPHSLLSAYARISGSDGKKLVADISTQDPLRSQRQTAVGPKSSLELFTAYGLGNDVTVPVDVGQEIQQAASNPSKQKKTSSATTTAQSSPETLRPASISKPSTQDPKSSSHPETMRPASISIPSPTTRAPKRSANPGPTSDDDDEIAEAIRRSLADQKTTSNSPTLHFSPSPITKQPLKRAAKPKAYSSYALNTSLGSLLDSSSEDERPLRRPVTKTKLPPAQAKLPENPAEVIEID